MKPTPLRPLRPSRFLFARGLSLKQRLLAVGSWSGWAAVIGVCGLVFMTWLAKHAVPIN